MIALSFSEHAPVGKVVTALERLDPALARGVEHTLDDDDNAFVVFDATTPAGRFVDALVALIDERVRMAQPPAHDPQVFGPPRSFPRSGT